MSDTKVVLKEARVAFPQVFIPVTSKFDADKKDANGEPLRTYSVQMRMYDSDPNTAGNVTRIKQAMKEAAVASWGQKAEAYFKSALESKNTRGLQRNEEEGYFYVNLKRKASLGAPKIVNRAKNPITEDAGLVVGGCYGNAVFTVFAYDANGNRGFSFTLCGLQWVKEGEPIGATAAASNADFEDYDDEESQGSDNYDFI